MKLEEAFGQILRQYRKGIGISQEGLALKCGLDRTYMSSLERGKRQPTLKTIFKLAKALNSSPSKMIADLETLISSSSCD